MLGVKLKLGLGISSLVLGIALLGGTYAYFNEIETIGNNNIKAGKLDLSHDKTSTYIFNVTDMVPGTSSEYPITLTNSGTIDISKVLLDVQYSSLEAGSTTNPIATETSRKELYDDIMITISAGSTIISAEKSLKQLSEAANQDINLGSITKSAGSLPLKILLSYEGADVNQNHQMGDSVKITFSFEATTLNN